MGAVAAVGARGIGVEALSPRDRQCDVLGVPRVGDLGVHLDALHRATNEQLGVLADLERYEGKRGATAVNAPRARTPLFSTAEGRGSTWSKNQGCCGGARAASTAYAAPFRSTCCKLCVTSFVSTWLYRACAMLVY